MFYSYSPFAPGDIKKAQKYIKNNYLLAFKNKVLKLEIDTSGNLNGNLSIFKEGSSINNVNLFN